MEDTRSISAKRKLDQGQDGVPNPPNKKIKLNTAEEKKDIIVLPDLPPEIHQHIISYFSDDNVRRHLRLVCQKWFDMINYNEFKIGVLLASEEDEFCRVFGRYEKPIGLKFMKMDYIYNSRENGNDNLMTTEQLNQMIRQLTQLTALDLRLFDIKIPKRLSNLQALTTISPISESIAPKFTNLQRLMLTIQNNPVAIAQLPPNLEYLDYDGQMGDEFTSQYTRVTTLKITTAHTDLFLEAHPNVRDLTVRDYGPYLAHNYDQVLTNLEKLVTNVNAPQLYVPTLTSLQVVFLAMNKVLKLTPNMTKLKVLDCASLQIDQKNLTLPALESCSVHSSDSSGTILQHLNSEKITKLRTSINYDNNKQFLKFTNLVDLDLQVNTKKPDLPSLPYLTKLNILYDNYLHTYASKFPNSEALHFSYLTVLAQTPKTFNFADFTALTALTIESTNIYDISVVGLTNLVSLHLIDQQRKPSKPAMNINGLSTLTNLTSLMFVGSIFRQVRRHTALQNWSDLSPLTKLRELSVYQEYSKNDFTNLTTLQKLTYLDISRAISSLDCLTKLSRLQQLTLNEDDDDKNVVLSDIWTKLPFCWRYDSHSMD